MIIGLSDGNVIVPRNIFDALDAVEEYMGSDIREYLEVWFEGDYDMSEEDSHLTEVLEYIEGQLIGLKSQKKKEQEETLQRVINLTRREIDGKENV